RGINLALDAVAKSDPYFAVVGLEGLPFESDTDVLVKPEGCLILGERMVVAIEKLEGAQLKK
ncbi:MAG: hypothetical protein KBF76_17320, partial [Verrucomicrobiales bacterium]|nr:hypothetical protein [Verrucomicrobiales bacterium]